MRRNVMSLAVFSIFLCILFFQNASARSWQHNDRRYEDSRHEELRSGTIIRVTGKPALYYVINGYAAHIPTMTVFKCMDLDRHRQVNVSQRQLRNMPKTALLIRGNNERIYLIDGESRRHITNIGAFRRLGFHEDEIISVDKRALRCIRKGPPLN
jgi:hypothetical protein